MNPNNVFRLIGFCLLFPLLGTSQNPDDSTIDSLPYSESQFTTINGVRLHYRSWPAPYYKQKGNIFLLHGFCASTYSWRKNIDKLTQAGYNIVAVDLPGFGYSHAPQDYMPTNTNNARLLWKFLDEYEQNNQRLKRNDWHLTGHSMGGGITALMAQINPQQTQSLIIVNGALYDNRSIGSYLFRVMFEIPPIDKVFQTISYKLFFNYPFFEEVIKNSYGHPPDSTVVINYLKPVQQKETVRTIMNMAASYDQLDLQPTQIYSPTLLIWGEHDELVTIRKAKALKKMMPNADLKIIKDSKHCPMETDTDTFHQVLLPFLDKHSSLPTQ